MAPMRIRKGVEHTGIDPLSASKMLMTARQHMVSSTLKYDIRLNVQITCTEIARMNISPTFRNAYAVICISNNA